MTDKRPSTAAKDRPSGSSTSNRRPSSSPTGTRRAGRRDVPRRRHEEQSTLQRYRAPLVAIGVVVILVVVGAFVLTSASSPAYACTTIDTVQPSQPGQIGQVQPDMGNGHVVRGDKITYPVCPPASGHHVNQPPYGPVPPRAYGPDADVLPNGWVHNLEHGGLVLLYSCDKGACDAATQAQLQDVYTGFPPSPVCGLPAGTVGPVITRFEQMPTKFAALLWDRALYLNELDVDQIYAFFNKYAEVVDDQGRWLAPPEPQCPAPTPSSAAPVESPSPS